MPRLSKSRTRLASLSLRKLPVLKLSMAAAIAAMAVTPAITSAQFSLGYQFLQAVKDREGDKVIEMVSNPGGSTLINTRDLTNGRTALHMVVERRDGNWVRFLLQKGADPNIRDKNGITPLMMATSLRYVDAAEALLKHKAKVDEANNSGETPLIMAVHLRDLAMVRLLLKNGADPDRVDSIAGRSARDYAEDIDRDSSIIDAIRKADSERKAAPEETESYGPKF